MKPVLPALIFLLFSCQNDKTNSGLSPQDALKTFTLADGFTIELVASEPMVADPVAMDVDEHGNLYVAEMHGYPLDTHGSGVIKLLTDTNGDGFPDKSTVYADSLVLPMGVMCWKKGIIVVDSPDVIYLEDTDGDGKADHKQILLTGFALSNPQHNANTPVFGLDNWIYIAHQGEVTPKVYIKEFGDLGTPIHFSQFPDAPTLPQNANGRSIRFKPDAKEIEMLSGESQYGQAFDPWGHLLGTANANHLFHEVIAARYLNRNPNLRPATSLQMLPDHGDACEVFPTTLNPEHQLLTDVGVITSSCGVTWYEGGLFPKPFDEITFIAEPVHNLVHIDKLADKGATFTASRVYERKEFLTSTDAWCRPVNFYTGPDGALYIIDYYRQIIEHPEWMSEEVAASGKLYEGSDKGRIYRVTPTGTSPLNWCGQIKLGDASSLELVKQLANHNIWWRRTAQRLLMDRHDASAVPFLKQLIDTTTFAPAVVHALWTLDGLAATDAGYLQKALKHSVAGVRENAIRIAELHLNEIPTLENDLLALQDDPDAKVRFQLLCTLGYLATNPAASARQEILRRDIEDEWVQVAALSATRGHEWEMLANAIKDLGDKETPGRRSFIQQCASVVALSNDQDNITKIISLATKNQGAADPWWQAAMLQGLGNVGKEVAFPTTALATSLLASFKNPVASERRKAEVALLCRKGIDDHTLETKIIQAARNIAPDETKDISLREDALSMLILDASADPLLYQNIISPTSPENLQTIAVRVYAKFNATAAGKYLVANWKTLTPGIRDVAMDAFLSSSQSAAILLDAIQSKQIQPATIGWPRMVELMNNDDADIKKRARALLAHEQADRNEIFKKYEPALSLKGDAVKGAIVFKNVCSLCHQINGANGRAFGPDLATIRNRDKQFIMADILDPNRSIADGYELWKIERTNGESLTGIISSETSATLTVRFASGHETTVPRNDIAKLEAIETSAMPRGLESAVSMEEMADLMAFIKSN
ncbi:putative membrane-bound dehydrogenase domain-containing protein [Chryseolinea serpens]|uniref:Putative membrane-bound dehydrogenase domain-containing protein n=1 Tax=Chryseolinea serpens TaxID=947013 RepID=A0A1M5RS19_9BACT|nr:PVC-type heme-binding CxxCH protein [Chryseolinea serpens]SHH29067.1 putative membrane-bound dehydrogenase domain-containing protein [Chryseolinea serpens]